LVVRQGGVDGQTSKQGRSPTSTEPVKAGRHVIEPLDRSRSMPGPQECVVYDSSTSEAQHDQVRSRSCFPPTRTTDRTQPVQEATGTMRRPSHGGCDGRYHLRQSPVTAPVPVRRPLSPAPPPGPQAAADASDAFSAIGTASSLGHQCSNHMAYDASVRQQRLRGRLHWPHRSKSGRAGFGGGKASRLDRRLVPKRIYAEKYVMAQRSLATA
jgi:hypothetical protein